LTFAQGDYLAWMREIYRLEWDAVHSYSRRKAAKVFNTLARNRTRVVPTLTVYQVLDRPDEIALTDERLAYVPSSTVESWRWALENLIKAGHTPEETAQRHELLDRRLAFVGAMAGAGVPVVAGTDGGDLPFVIPGFGLHDELGLLVRAGLTPLDAVRAATVESAALLGLDRLLGTVEVGKLADLVVLDADPLTDIRSTTCIHAVLSRGRVINADQRTRMLADIAATAESEAMR
jgi:hypothetical protein